MRSISDNLQETHLDRCDYSDFATALLDTERVASDLVELVSQQLVIPSSDVAFLARRLQQLTEACRVELARLEGGA